MKKRVVLICICLSVLANGCVRLRRAVPAAPTSEQDALLRAVLEHALRDKTQKTPTFRGTVLLLKHDQLITPRMLPEVSEKPFVLVTEGDLKVLAYRSQGERPRYLRVGIESLSEDTAVAILGEYPAVRENEVAMCCWTQLLRYRKVRGKWEFVEVITTYVH